MVIRLPTLMPLDSGSAAKLSWETVMTAGMSCNTANESIDHQGSRLIDTKSHCPHRFLPLKSIHPSLIHIRQKVFSFYGPALCTLSFIHLGMNPEPLNLCLDPFS